MEGILFGVLIMLLFGFFSGSEVCGVILIALGVIYLIVLLVRLILCAMHLSLCTYQAICGRQLAI